MQYSLIYDAVVVIALLTGISKGYKKGAVKMILSITFTLISIGAASYLSSERFCEKLYDEYIRDKVTEVCTNAVNSSIEKAKDEISRKTKDTIRQIPDSIAPDNKGISDIADDVISFIDEHSKDIDDTISSIADSIGLDVGEIISNEAVSEAIDRAAEKYSESAVRQINAELPAGLSIKQSQIEQALSDKKLIELFINDMLRLDSTKTGYTGTVDYIERTMIRPVALRAIHLVSWTVIFAVLRILFQIISSVIIAIKRSIPVINSADKIAGSALGLVSSIMAVTVLAFIISRIIMVTDNIDYINSTVVNDTIIFRYVYDLVAPGNTN
ncbi:MAG: hypothetical protein IJ251_06315 [Oscillospiraceae bacterium]|nr:hypothetical protein [Oscillospiraceae bacterium]